MSYDTVSKHEVPHVGDECPECGEARIIEIEPGERHCPSGDCATTWSQHNSLTWRQTEPRFKKGDA